MRPSLLMALALVVSCGKSHLATENEAGVSPDSGGGSLPSGLFECRIPTDCQLIAKTCCGWCGEATLADVMSVNREHAGEYSPSLCEPNTVCLDCEAQPNPNLLSDCQQSDTANRCAAIDVRQDAISACQSDSDCRLALPSCCACTADYGDWHNLVAINVDSYYALQRLTCGYADTLCEVCPDDSELDPYARCSEDGHCFVGFPDD